MSKLNPLTQDSAFLNICHNHLNDGLPLFICGKNATRYIGTVKVKRTYHPSKKQMIIEPTVKGNRSFVHDVFSQSAGVDFLVIVRMWSAERSGPIRNVWMTSQAARPYVLQTWCRQYIALGRPRGTWADWTLRSSVFGGANNRRRNRPPASHFTFNIPECCTVRLLFILSFWALNMKYMLWVLETAGCVWEELFLTIKC